MSDKAIGNFYCSAKNISFVLAIPNKEEEILSTRKMEKGKEKEKGIRKERERERERE